MNDSEEIPPSKPQNRIALCQATISTVDLLLPRSTGGYAHKTNNTLSTGILNRLLDRDVEDSCEDPLIDRNYWRILKEDWSSFTPSRLSSVTMPSKFNPTSTGILVDYAKHSSCSLNHPGKRAIPCDTPAKAQPSAVESMKYNSNHKRKKMLRGATRKRTRYDPEHSDLVQAQSWKLDHSAVSSEGWQGRDASSMDRNQIREALASKDPKIMRVLAAFTLIWYDWQASGPTRIVDSEGRLFIFRSRVSTWQTEALPQLAKAIETFAKATAQTVEERQKNHRGMQQFCIAGIDRQRKQKPTISGWETKGSRKEALDELFKDNAMVRFNACASSLVMEHFPAIAKRLENAIKVVQDKYGLSSTRYGLFFNFCINSPVFEEGMHDVFTLPHSDAKNAAIMVCVVMVYYFGNCVTNADERIWLVFWEAGIILQIPAGSFVIYPSALLLHFNVDINDILYVTNDGSVPTKETAVPFVPSSNENGGRGSIVWFTQASMMQSAELPTNTISEAKELNRKAHRTGSAQIKTSYDAHQAMKDGLFPFDFRPT